MSGTQGQDGKEPQHQQQFHMQPFPQPQQKPGILMGTMAVLSRLGVASIAGIVVTCGLQAIMPPGSKPSDLIGGLHGATTTATLDSERRAQTETAAQMAQAQARAQAQWAMEVETSRQQQAAILQSLDAKQQAANLADYACMAGRAATVFWGRDAQGFAAAAQLACAEAAQLRGEIVQAQAEAARLGSAIMQRQQQMQQPQFTQR